MTKVGWPRVSLPRQPSSGVSLGVRRSLARSIFDRVAENVSHRKIFIAGHAWFVIRSTQASRVGNNSSEEALKKRGCR